MEAILKAFEKMEKREERRKEALARNEPIRKTSEKQDSSHTESDRVVIINLGILL